MQKYKITASKSQKKYQFVLSAENEKLAKERVHKDGYSILAVELFDENNVSRDTFIFEAEKLWEIKNWKVIWDDIFKIYLKLRDWVWYNVLKLYSKKDEEKSENYKKNIIKELEEQYFYYKNTKKWKEKIKDKNIKEDKNAVNIDDFYMKKQLEETYKLIDFVLWKLNKLLKNEKYNLDNIKKEKLKNLYNSLVKIKSSTNISKLKEVWEAVLLKVWEIELDSLEKFKDNESKQFLNETNNLLKKIWSEKKFIEENKDIKKIFEKVVSQVWDFLKDITKKEKKIKNKWLKDTDKWWYDYLKNIIFLNKYKQKLKENTIILLKNFWIFILPFWKFATKKQDLLIKRKVIKQNIYLFKAKLNWKVFSYTQTIKWFNYVLDLIFNFFNYIKDYLFFVVLFYSLLFLIFLNFNYYNIVPWFEWSLNYNWIFYFIIFLFIYFAIYFSRWVYSLFFNFFILIFIIWLWIVNF